HIEAFKVNVVDTTGAGDAFCAGFLYGLIKSKNLYDCGRIGNFVASKCIMKMGARTGLPYIKDQKLLD
ncbi:sugar kinase, partial [Candidatus Bathyarchaeota archaeon]